MSYLDDQLQFATREDLEAIFAFKRSDCINRFTAVESLPPTKEKTMSQEERTRDEVLNCLVAQTAALTAITRLLIDKMVANPNGARPEEKIEDTIGAPPPAVKKTRALKSKAHDELVAKVEQAEAEAAPVTQTPAPVEKMAEIVPTKPGKTLADLRVALQACITKHGMPEAKIRLQPYNKVSDVPDEALAAAIDKLTA